MTFKVGRLELVAPAGPELWDQAGDRASVTGHFYGPNVADAKVLRQQLSGYVDNHDEEIVPVTWSGDSTVDGFYRVLDAQVSMVPSSLADGWFEFSLSLERTAGYAAPSFESVLLGALRANSHSITTAAIAWHAVPYATRYYDISGALGTEQLRIGEGTIQVVHNGSGLFDANARWTVPSANFYGGAVKFQVATGTAILTWDGDPLTWAGEILTWSVLRTVVGGQIADLPSKWRLSNSLVSVTPVSGTCHLDISCFDGTDWETAVRLRLGRYAASAFDEFDEWVSVTVLRNSPECVSIRLSAAPLAGVLGTNFFVVDLTLRRGARTVEIVTSSDASFFGMLKLDAVTGCTALTGGIRRTSNDAGGNRFVMSTPLAFTSDLVNGSIRATSFSGTYYAPFMAGLEVGGNLATGLEDAQSLIFQYMAATSERLTVRAR